LPEQVNSTKRPNRLDWSFTWERHGFKAKDAPERLTIALNGADVGSATETLKVPEQWERDYEHLRSTNIFLNNVAIVPYLLLMGGVLWFGIQMTRRGQTSWWLALQLGVIVAILLTAMQLNRWPVDVIGYDTNSSYGSFVIHQILGALLFGVISALTVSLVLPGGEPFYREAKPHLLRLKKALTWRGLRTKEFFSSIVVGLSFAGAHMGFLVAFYLIANHFGAWAPQEINYEDSVSTAIPWIGGIAIGLLAATSEEFLFRLFAIPFLQKFTKSRVLAVILPAFSWGFLHTAYPNEPPYIRGLEVGLIGIAAGVVMLRWGIIATLVWHYTVDAALVGLLLIRSSSLYFRISGIVVGLAVLIPFGYAVYSRMKRGSFEEDQDLLNQAPDPADVATVREEEPARALSHAPTGSLSKGVLVFLVVCVLLGGFAALKIEPVHLGDYLKLSVNAKEATARAGEILKQRGVDPKSYKSVATLVDVTDPTASEYLRQKIGVKALNETYEKQVPGALWDVRFFRDQKTEEYSVILRPDGTLHSLHHEIEEKAAGASLSKEEAIVKATAYLASENKIDPSGWNLVDSSSEKRPNRIDHTLIWQAKEPLDSQHAATNADSATHAFRRAQVTVLGDEVTNYRTFIKIPDEWRRKQDLQSIWRTLHSVFVLCLPLGIGIAALVFFLREIKSELMKQVPWRRLTGWGLFALAAFLATCAFGDRIPMLLSQYKTSVPLKYMYGGLAIGFTVGALFYLGLVVILFAMGWFFLKQAYGSVQWPGWRGMPPDYYRDAFFIGIGGTAAMIALSRATEFVLRRWPTPHRAFPAGFGLDFDSYVPGISISAAAVLHGLLFAAALAAAGGFVLAHCKSPLLRIMLFVAASVALVSGWGSPADFLKQWLAQLILLAAVVFGIARVARLNLLGYFLVLAVPSLILGAQELLSQPNGLYRQQGYIVIAALTALLLWPLVEWRKATSSTVATTTEPG
jgi:membrane protease YdiL (CAAX protease family)